MGGLPSTPPLPAGSRESFSSEPVSAGCPSAARPPAPVPWPRGLYVNKEDTTGRQNGNQGFLISAQKTQKELQEAAAGAHLAWGGGGLRRVFSDFPLGLLYLGVPEKQDTSLKHAE